ncbi:MAG: hypothetical protein J2P15_21015 [Micromonosporaceae bacterium]|nr:hypothetical protein [Micromonosporaceae bacterium]
MGPHRYGPGYGPSYGPPAPVSVGLGRSNTSMTLLVLAALGTLVGVSGYGGFHSTGSARILGYGFAALFAVPLVMMLVGLPRLLRPRYLVFEPRGMRIVAGRVQVAIGWEELHALGLGYEQAPEKEQVIPTSVDDVQDRVAEYLSGKVSEALQVSDARRIALEIFPTHPQAVERYPLLRPYWHQQAPPYPGLPWQRWRFPLPPVVSIGEAVGAGVWAFQPRRWLGWFPRPWSGKSGRR